MHAKNLTGSSTVPPGVLGILHCALHCTHYTAEARMKGSICRSSCDQSCGIPYIPAGGCAITLLIRVGSWWSLLDLSRLSRPQLQLP